MHHSDDLLTIKTTFAEGNRSHRKIDRRKLPFNYLNLVFLKERKPSIQLQKIEEPDSSTGPALEFQDPRLYLKSAARQRRQFDFKQPGEYEKLAKVQRSKAKLEKLQVFTFHLKYLL